MNAQNRQTEVPDQSVGAEELYYRYLHKTHESIKAAEEHENAVNVRRAQMKGAVIDELSNQSRQGRRMDQASIDERLDQRLATDKVYKRMIAGNQWNISKATMYSTAALAFKSLMDLESNNSGKEE